MSSQQAHHQLPHRHQPHHRHRVDFRLITSLTVVVAAVLIALHLGLPNLTILGSRSSEVPVINSTPRSASATSSSLKHPTMAASVRRTTPLVFPAVGRHTATVIFAHGLGDTGHGWQSAVDHFRARQKLDEVKFILPHAPHIPITVNGGFQMPGWFDIASLGGSVEDMRRRPVAEDATGILASRDYFNSLVQEEISAGIPSDRIILGGFSQGGAMSIFTGLTSPVKLAGIIGLSSWLLLSKSIKDHIAEANPNKDTPIFMGHGSDDPVVRYDLGQESQRVIKEMGYNVKLETYSGMAHSACLEELDEVAKFLATHLPPK